MTVRLQCAQSTTSFALSGNHMHLGIHFEWGHLVFISLDLS